MSMKYNLSRLLTFLVLIFSACNNTENNNHDLMNHGQSDSLYTCPMHPEVVQDQPGSCPKCGMALEPREITLEEEDNPQLTDMTRRFWIGLVLAFPVFILAMSEMIPGQPVLQIL